MVVGLWVVGFDFDFNVVSFIGVICNGLIIVVVFGLGDLVGVKGYFF